MPRLNSTDVIETYVKTLEVQARNSSDKVYKETLWPFMYGYTQSDIRFMLESLSLTQKQLKILDDRLAKEPIDE